MDINAALDNFPSTDPVELYERQIDLLKAQVRRLNEENANLQTRLNMTRAYSSELKEIKAEPRELHVSINLQL